MALTGISGLLDGNPKKSSTNQVGSPGKLSKFSPAKSQPNQQRKSDRHSSQSPKKIKEVTNHNLKAVAQDGKRVSQEVKGSSSKDKFVKETNQYISKSSEKY